MEGYTNKAVIKKADNGFILTQEKLDKVLVFNDSTAISSDLLSQAAMMFENMPIGGSITLTVSVQPNEKW